MGRLRGLGFWGSRRVTGPSGQGTAGGDVCVEYVLVVGHSNGYCGWYHRIL